MRSRAEYRKVVPRKGMNGSSRWLPVFTVMASLHAVFQESTWAQDNRVSTVGEEERPAWRFTVTPHLWVSSFTGRVGVGRTVSEVDLGFGDIFGDLNFGVMGLFEGRRHPWVIRTDLLFASLGEERALSADGSGTLQIDQEQLMLHPELGYTILTRPWGGVDALLGVRYWHLIVDLSAPPQALSGNQYWVDGTVGASVRYQPDEGWRVFAKADAGAGGSDFTWQVYGGGGYDLGRCCTVVAAYRYLDVDYEQDNALVYDVAFHGPTIGMTLRF